MKFTNIRIANEEIERLEQENAKLRQANGALIINTGNSAVKSKVEAPADEGQPSAENGLKMRIVALKEFAKTARGIDRDCALARVAKLTGELNSLAK